MSPLQTASTVSWPGPPACRTSNTVSARRIVSSPFTGTLAAWYIDERVPGGRRIGIVPCFPAGLSNVVKRNPVPGRIGFVAGDFAAKGGHTVIAAMSRVPAKLVPTHTW